jgi:uncharacterized membrane protein YqhA
METKGNPGEMARTAESRVERVLAASLRLVIIAVVILVLAALGAFVYGTAVFIHSVGSVISHPFPVGSQIGLFLLDVDLFLIGATLLIAAVGLYELFIREVRTGNNALPIPAWLEMRDLDDLKGRVVGIIVVVLSVGFVEIALDYPNGQQVLELGGGVASVIVALTIFLRLTGRANEANHRGNGVNNKS